MSATLLPLLVAGALAGDTTAAASAASPPDASRPLVIDRPVGAARGAARAPDGPAGTPAFTTDTTPRPRPRAVELSAGYEKRLTVHRWLSYTTLPLFAAQYVLGDRLIDAREGGREASSSTRNLHATTAGVLGGVFAVNTVTGLWNLWETRAQPAGQGKRLVHTALMLAADAGFVATGALAEKNANTHRTVAIGSMGVATAGAALMWFWKD